MLTFTEILWAVLAAWPVALLVFLLAWRNGLRVDPDPPPRPRQMVTLYHEETHTLHQVDLERAPSLFKLGYHPTRRRVRDNKLAIITVEQWQRRNDRGLWNMEL